MKYISHIILVTLAICIVWIIVISGLTDLSSRECLFLSVLLTGLAIAASWLGTGIASKSTSEQMKNTLKTEYMENLRTYALKAAEKVQNLSAEMERLIDYVNESPPSEKEGLSRTLIERFKTVSIMLETIKSVNDTALSDWRGIIGDELKKQEQIKTDIDEIFSKIEDLEEAITTPTTSTGQLTMIPSIYSATVPTDWSSMFNYNINTRLEDIDKDIVNYASSSPIPVRLPRKRRINATVKCPKCESENSTRVNMRDGYKKVIRCNNCLNYFAVTVDSDQNIGVESIGAKEVAIKCMLCDYEHTVTYPLWPSYVIHHECPKCRCIMYANVDKAQELQYRQSENITKRFLEIIEQLVDGKYPDATTISGIAREIGVSKAKITQGIKVLVNLERIEGPEEEQEEVVDEELEQEQD